MADECVCASAEYCNRQCSSAKFAADRPPALLVLLLVLLPANRRLSVRPSIHRHAAHKMFARIKFVLFHCFGSRRVASSSRLC